MEGTGLAQAAFNPRIKISTAADVVAEVVADFPYYCTIKDMTSLDPLAIHYFLISQGLLRRDTHVDVRMSCIRLSDATFENTSERKRFKNNARKSIMPTRDYESTGLLPRRPIHQDQVTATMDILNPGRVKSCDNHIVVKGKLIALLKLMNKELLATCEGAKSRSPFDNRKFRLKVLTEWVNWIFFYKYGIKSTYSHEQVRQMIKSKNIHGGRLEIVPPCLEV